MNRIDKLPLIGLWLLFFLFLVMGGVAAEEKTSRPGAILVLTPGPGEEPRTAAKGKKTSDSAGRQVPQPPRNQQQEATAAAEEAPIYMLY